MSVGKDVAYNMTVIVIPFLCHSWKDVYKYTHWLVHRLMRNSELKAAAGQLNN